MYLFSFIFTLFLIKFSYSACPSGAFQGLEGNNKCYKVISTTKRWLDAEVECTKQNGFLATIDSGFLNSLVLDFLQEAVPNATSFWIGRNVLLEQGQWAWSDGSDSSYMNWGQSQPSNSSQGFCTSVHVADGKWYSEDCFGPWFNASNKPFVCGIPPVETSPCPNGWIYQNETGKCYYVSSYSQEGTFEQNRNFCKNIGGDLVTIHSFNENSIVGGSLSSFMAKMSSDIVYFGANFIGLQKVNNAWQWVDGTPANFTNFGLNYFGNGTGDYVMFRCVEGNVYTWEAVTDSYTNCAFCEAKPGAAKAIDDFREQLEVRQKFRKLKNLKSSHVFEH